jgi:hypothetical protein
MEQTLSLDQVADVINRAKLGNQKHKNELMRLGTSDPTSFKSQFSKQLNEQQQPSEFWGAGRKLAQNQNPDEELNNYVGDALPTLGGDRYYYGNTDFSIPENVQSSIINAGYKPTTSNINPTLYNLFGNNTPITKFRNQEYYKGDIDPSKGQFGTQGYTQQDIGNGQYNILDTSGNSLGIGYKGLEDAIRELVTTQKQAPVGFNPNEDFQGFPTPNEYSNTSRYSSGDLDKWEVLGQVLSGQPLNYDPTSNRTSYALSGDNLNQDIKGLNTLFGSTPVFYNNQLKGYTIDPTPVNESDVGYVNPQTILREDTKGSTKYNYALQRQYNDLNKWKDLSTNIDSNNLFIPKENAENIPGWTNVDNAQYYHESNGLFPKIAQGLGTILQFTPFAPAGLALSTLGSLTQGNHLGGILGALQTGLGQAGVFDEIGDYFNKDLGKYFVKGGISALSDLAQGKNIKQSLLNGIGSPTSDYLGNITTNDLSGVLGNFGSKLAGSGVSGALRSLFSGNNPIEGALTNSLSTGLGDFLSTMTNNTGENIDSKRTKAYENLSKVITNIAKQQYKRRH